MLQHRARHTDQKECLRLKVLQQFTFCSVLFDVVSCMCLTFELTLYVLSEFGLVRILQHFLMLVRSTIFLFLTKTCFCFCRLLKVFKFLSKHKRRLQYNGGFVETQDSSAVPTSDMTSTNRISDEQLSNGSHQLNIIVQCKVKFALNFQELFIIASLLW